MLLVQSADDLLGIEHFVALHHLNVSGGHFAFFVHNERKLLRLVIIGFKFHFLEIKDDVGHVLHHAWERGEFMLRACDFGSGDGCAFQRGKQDPPEGIPNGVPVTSLKWLGGEFGVSIGGCALVFSESLRHFKTTVTDWHMFLG